MKRLNWIWLVLFFAALCGGALARCQTIDSSVHVNQFKGATVGAKVANAMLTCVASPVPCILVLDPSLHSTPVGSMPSLCGNCYLSDWRAGPPATNVNGINITPNNVASTLFVSGLGFSTVAPGTNCVFEGDSITVGYGLPNNTFSWPNQAISLPELENCAAVGSESTFNNFAVSGSTVETMQARYSAVHALSPAVTGKPGQLFVLAGTNNIGTENETAAATFALLETYWAGAAADGYVIEVGTLTPRSSPSELTAAQDNQRFLLNSLIRSAVGDKFAYLMDFDRALQDPTDANFFQDGLHPTAQGAKVMAQVAASASSARSGIQAVANPYNGLPTVPTYTNALNLANGTDLNTVTACGTYDLNGVVNGPPGFSSTPNTGNSWAHVEVLCNSVLVNGYAAQIATSLLGPSATPIAVWFRNEYAGIWTSWVSLQPASVNLPASTDLNTVIACGTYNGGSLVNAPAPIGSGDLHLVVLCSDLTTSAFFVTQIATNQAAAGNQAFIRNEMAGTWNAWSPLAAYGGASALTAGTVTIGAPLACTPSSTCIYQFTNCGPSGSALGIPTLGAVAAGSAFVINSLSATNALVTGDTSSICWRIN